MNKNNLIRFAQSLLLLPFVTGTTVPLGSILIDATKETNQTVFIQKQNIEADGLLAFNQVVDQKAKDLKSKADAIDAFFREHNMPLEGEGMKMVKEAGYRTGKDYTDALSRKIEEMVAASVEKVKADGKKKTLGLEDL